MVKLVIVYYLVVDCVGVVEQVVGVGKIVVLQQLVDVGVGNVFVMQVDCFDFVGVEVQFGVYLLQQGQIVVVVVVEVEFWFDLYFVCVQVLYQ